MRSFKIGSQNYRDVHVPNHLHQALATLGEALRETNRGNEAVTKTFFTPL
jgi:hypothetical protein